MVNNCLAGKSAVVTGGASGIGLSTTLRFLEEGANVVVGDFNAAAGAALLVSLESSGFEERVRFVRTDVAAEADVIRLIDEACAAFDGIDIMFNNAGVGGAFGSLTEIHVEDWDYTFAVLVRGVFLGTKHAAARMIAQGRGGSIINTASVAGHGGGAGPVAYSAAKAAVLNLTRLSAVELAPHRIRVNSVSPGAIMTPLLHNGRPDAAAQELAAVLPWSSVGEPKDVAGAVAYYASSDSDYVTGDDMVVDGGLLAAGPRLGVGRSARTASTAGVNRGSTGEPAVVRTSSTAGS